MKKVSRHKLNLMLIFLIASYLIGCSECPPDKNIGEAFISNKSKEYMPYEEGPITLSFENSNGKTTELISTAGMNNEVYDIVVAKPCSKTFIDETNYSVKIENENIYFYNDSVTIGLRIDLSILDNETSPEIVDTNWVETIEYYFGTKMITGNHRILIISNDRGKDYNMSNIESYKFYDSLEIIDEVFYQVYTNIDGEQFFITKDLGLVGFKYDTIEFKLSNL